MKMAKSALLFPNALERFNGLFSSGMRMLTKRSGGRGMHGVTEIPLVGPRITLDLAAKINPSEFSSYLYEKLGENKPPETRDNLRREYGEFLQKLGKMAASSVRPENEAQAIALVAHAFENIDSIDCVRIENPEIKRRFYDLLSGFLHERKLTCNLRLGGQSGHEVNAVRNFFRGSVILHGSKVPYLRYKSGFVGSLLPSGSRFTVIDSIGRRFLFRWGQIEPGRIPSDFMRVLSPTEANLSLEFRKGERSERLLIVGERNAVDEFRPGIRNEDGKLVDLTTIDPGFSDSMLFVSRLQHVPKNEVRQLNNQLQQFKGVVVAETSGKQATSWAPFKHVDIIGTNEKEIASLAKAFKVDGRFSTDDPESVSRLLGRLLEASPRLKAINFHFKNGIIRAVKKEVLPDKVSARSLIDVGALTAAGLAMHHAGISPRQEAQSRNRPHDEGALPKQDEQKLGQSLMQDSEDKPPKFAANQEGYTSFFDGIQLGRRQFIDHQDVKYHLDFCSKMAGSGAIAQDSFGHVWETRHEGKKPFLVSFMPKFQISAPGEHPVAGAGDTAGVLSAMGLAKAIRTATNQTRKKK